MKNTGRLPVNIKGWTLSDKSGHSYRFGNLRLNGHSQIRVHTGIGYDNRRDIYQDRRAYGTRKPRPAGLQSAEPEEWRSGWGRSPRRRGSDGRAATFWKLSQFGRLTATRTSPSCRWLFGVQAAISSDVVTSRFEAAGIVEARPRLAAGSADAAAVWALLRSGERFRLRCR